MIFNYENFLNNKTTQDDNLLRNSDVIFKEQLESWKLQRIYDKTNLFMPQFLLQLI